MEKVFLYNDYKKYLKALVNSPKAPWGYISKIAAAAGCQRSYFSRVLSAEIHLTPDHAFNLSRFLEFSEAETDYFLLLLEKDRASTATYRNKVLEKLKRLKADQERLENVVSRPPINVGEKEVLYYSTWLMSALHIIVSIPSYQTVAAISARLQTPPDIVESILKQLSEMNLISKKGNRWTFAMSEVHIPNGSVLSALHHNNWRQRALLDAQRFTDESIHFSVVQSMDAKAYEKIRQKVRKLIEEAAQIAGPAPSDELFAFTCDLFRV